ICVHHGCAPRRSRTTRRGWGARPAAECMIRHSAIDARAWVAWQGPSAPRAARSADPLIVDQPAGPAQQLGDLAIAVAAILPDQLDDVGGQPCLVVSTVRDLALRRAMLTECRAGTELGNRQRSLNMLDAGAAARGA